MISCRKCGYTESESKIHEHHIIPKEIGGTDIYKDVRNTIWLCEKCHRQIHLKLFKMIFGFLSGEQQTKAKDWIYRQTIWWSEK